jgi:acyl-CoA synthetase (AMP-forming)/AMP-acid ligase II
MGVARGSLGALNPMRLYERWEAVTTLLALGASLPDTPWLTVQRLPSIWRWRSNPAGIVVLGAARHPDRPAIVDDGSELSYGELDARTSAIALRWRSAGLDEDTTVGVLAGNGRTFVEASVAAQKLGADVVYLNGAFQAPQVAQVVQDEGIDVLAFDDEHAKAATQRGHRLAVDEAELQRLGAAHEPVDLPPPRRPGRVIVLTSGTTGRPKGAARSGRLSSPLDGAGILTCIPFAPREVAVVAAPMFHGLGLFSSNLTLALGGTVVLRGRFDPERTLGDVAERRATVLVVVPLMLQRILELPRRRIRLFDTSSLRVVVCGGAQLPAELARRFMDQFGEVLYNVYGSTETALATVAPPRDLRAAPGTAGRPVPGSTVAIVDDSGRPARTGTSGRVFVGSSFGFEGYTTGGGKDQIGRLIATGDVGHFDRWGRLFVDGREDDMIISGGENVFPGEVEDLLGEHPAVAEAAVVAVDDSAFGQRLRAFVVPRPGSLVDEDELKAYVHDRLARFKTPRDVVFVDSLPRTATGKVLKRELRPAAA